MKAIVINQFGTQDVLEIKHDTPEPSVHSNQVLIKVHSAGINPLDWKIRQGELKFLLGAKFPIILGNDASGVIIKEIEYLSVVHLEVLECLQLSLLKLPGEL